MPPPASGASRRSALGIAAIRLPSESATYTVCSNQDRPVATAEPVGPTTTATGSVRSGKPLAMTVFDRTRGGRPGGVNSTMRTTVPPSTGVSPEASVPLRTFVTYRTLVCPKKELVALRSHGPLIGDPEIVLTGMPTLLSTIRHPAFAVSDFPSVVGRLPTTT